MFSNGGIIIAKKDFKKKHYSELRQKFIETLSFIERDRFSNGGITMAKKKFKNKHYETLRRELMVILGLIEGDKPVDVITEKMKVEGFAIKPERILDMLSDCEERMNSILTDEEKHNEVNSLLYLREISSALGVKIINMGVVNLKDFEKYTLNDVKESKQFGTAALVELLKTLIKRNCPLKDKTIDDLKVIIESYELIA